MSPPLELPANDHKSTIDVGHALRMLDDVHKARPVGPAKEKENEQESVGATFVHSLAYDLVEARVDGVLQFYDHSGKTRLGLCSTPDQAQFGSNRWLAQQAGSAGATALTFLLLRKAFGGGAQAQSVGRSVTTAALTGAVYQGVFTPSKASGSNADFFKGRLENAGIGAATFATLDGSARGLGLLGRQGSLSLLKSGVVGSTLAGLPAGFVSTELSTGGKASKEQIGQSMFTYAMIGGAFGIAHSLKSAATPETGKVETAAVVKPALEPVPVVKPTMVEKALAAGRCLPLYLRMLPLPRRSLVGAQVSKCQTQCVQWHREWSKLYQVLSGRCPEWSKRRPTLSNLYPSAVKLMQELTRQYIVLVRLYRWQPWPLK